MKITELEERQRPQRAKKDTKHYCKGKTDKPHNWTAWEHAAGAFSLKLYERKCKNCGKLSREFRRNSLTK